MEASRDYARIERAIRFLAAARAERPSLSAVAAHVGLSPFHFQRLFQRFAGTTPKRFLQHLTATAARQRLLDARTVLATTLDLGLSSPGRLHDLMVSVHGMTPGEVGAQGAGLAVAYGVHATPYGPAFVAASERGIVRLAFLDEADPAAPAERDALNAAWPQAVCREDAQASGRWAARAFQVVSGAREPLPVLVRGTNLQLQVWAALLRIPVGATTSYGSLARALDRPGAARAVAGAVGANAVAYLIPCHRVLRATGALGGYRWGTARKQVMLAREACQTDRLPSTTVTSIN